MFCLSGFRSIVLLKTFKDLKKISRHIKFKNTNLRNCSSLQQDVEEQQPRYNPINIQMLSNNLHQQIFGNDSKADIDSIVLKDVMLHLSKHGLLGAETTTVPDVRFNLPKLHNSNIIDHFSFIATQLLADYKNLLLKLLNSEIPHLPKTWEFQEGWTKYSAGQFQSVDYPEESAIVFDVEVCMQDGNYPTIATAVSNKHWYLWCSKRLIQNEYSWSKSASLSDLIPLETVNNEMKPHQDEVPRLIVGHNVAFDRAFVKEQYFLEQTKSMFLDTMSLHMCVSGLTGIQRAMSLANKKNPDPKDQNFFTVMGWSEISSLNNLADVYKLYCDEELEKSKREIFITGSLADVRENFQDLATYCATDTLATYKVLKKVMPMYFERFPHPVTLYGLLEMSTAYLPVNQNWEKYLQESQSTYDDLQKELKLSLMHLANDACTLLHNDLYKKDPWLWDLNWSTQDLKFRKVVIQPKKKKRKKSSNVKDTAIDNPEISLKPDDSEVLDMNKNSSFVDLDPALKHIYESASSLRKVRPFLPGYPTWYRELCDKNDLNPDWEPGPILISSQMRCVPKLMRMTWDGYPLHYDAKHGWGYLVPNIIELDSAENGPFPLKSLMGLLHADTEEDPKQLLNHDAHFYWPKIKEPREDQEYLYWRAILSTVPSNKSQFDSEPHHGIGPHDVGINGCNFFRLPHKDGPQKRVGNPLSKDFLPKVEDGTLRTLGKEQADRALLLSKMLSYWKNAHGRIVSQMVLWFNHQELPEIIKKNPNYDDSNSYGAILPRLIPAGTVTRRAVEPTWLTASNAYEDRIGSELKSMIQSPPGYHFVGADVDSQELWLAALFGDSYFAKCHGATAFGWMTLQGKKSAGTDMHSKTAASVGIGRDQAKILNYARIYGAGKTFAQRLLMQFNHRLTSEEALKKVKKMYAETKGVHKSMKKEEEMEESGYVFAPGSQRRKWIGGSESHMFNKLEEIALSKTPRTPALGCRISRALEPRAVDTNFMTSRVNWVVQSSAVDFLHLMLVCMKWLCKEYSIQGRYSICIHDEVRYLVKSEDRYRAALALQITNLLTRCFFTSKVGINDLPQSVAFFSSVDIDTVLRKEVHMDSKTPSNPHGLHKGYGIPPGEALDILDILQKTNGGQLCYKAE